MWETARGYAYAIRNFFDERLEDENMLGSRPTYFGDRMFGKFTTKLTNAFKERVSLTGDLLSNPREASTDADRETLAKTSVWKGDTTSAEFLSLNTGMYTFSGRSSETANARPDHVYVDYKKEAHIRYPVIKQSVRRNKQTNEQDCATYPHRVSCIILCFVHVSTNWYFNLTVLSLFISSFVHVAVSYISGLRGSFDSRLFFFLSIAY